MDHALNVEIQPFLTMLVHVLHVKKMLLQKMGNASNVEYMLLQKKGNASVHHTHYSLRMMKLSSSVVLRYANQLRSYMKMAHARNVQTIGMLMTE